MYIHSEHIKRYEFSTLFVEKVHWFFYCKLGEICLPSNLPKDFFLVQQVWDEDPTGSGHHILGQVLSVWLAVGHAPAKGEVLFKHFMANVDQDGVHTWKGVQTQQWWCVRWADNNDETQQVQKYLKPASQQESNKTAFDLKSLPWGFPQTL